MRSSCLLLGARQAEGKLYAARRGNPIAHSIDGVKVVELGGGFVLLGFGGYQGVDSGEVGQL